MTDITAEHITQDDLTVASVFQPGMVVVAGRESFDYLLTEQVHEDVWTAIAITSRSAANPLPTLAVTVNLSTVHAVPRAEQPTPGQLMTMLATFHGYAVEREQERTRSALRRLGEARDEFDSWKERATETAHAYANRNDLCGEFDRCMEDIGLPGRAVDHTVSVTVTITHRASVTITARDADDAAEQVGTDEIIEAIEQETGVDINSLDGWDYEITGAERD